MSRHRRELSDEQWAKLEPLPPSGGRPGVDGRRFLNAVPFVAETGVPWRDLPPRPGNRNGARRRFSRWAEEGRWERLAAALDDPDLTELHPDSTGVRAHPHGVRAHPQASGSRRLPGEERKTPTTAGGSAGPAAGRRRSCTPPSTPRAARCGRA